MTPPSGWREFTLGQLVELSNGVNAPKGAYGRGTPFVNVLEVITTERLKSADLLGRVTLAPTLLDRYLVRRGDILFNRTSETQDEVGLAAVYDDDAPAVFGGFVFRGRLLGNHLDPAFATYALRAADVRRQIVLRGQGGIRANVGQRDLKTVKILLPPLDEQKRIAEVLQAADSQVHAIHQLIGKKRMIRDGLRQHLLTGLTRLDGYESEWEAVRLGDHVTFLRSVPLSRAQMDASSPVRCLHYGDVHGAESASYDGRATSIPRAADARVKRADRLRCGDLVFADASEDPDGVGKSVEIAAVPPEGLVAGLHTIAARFDQRVLADGFKGYLQFIPEFRTALLRLVAGTKVLATTRAYLASVELALPPVEEQRAILRVLSDADAELEVLREELEKARRTRTGLTQELVTGRTRLSLDDAA